VTVAEACCVIVPTTSPALTIAVVAAACVKPTTFGTLTPAGPVETTRATALPAATDVPATGFCEITLPAGTVAEACCVIVPTTSPALMIAVVAAACVKPTTFGTLTPAGPVETTRATALPAATEVPATGFCEITLPAGTVAEACCVIVPTTSPALMIAVVAAACVKPTTFGTLTGAGPVETTRFTALPAATDVPATGFCEITLPAGTVAEACCVIVPTTSPALMIAVVAAACVKPTTFGTATPAPPVDTTMST